MSGLGRRNSLSRADCRFPCRRFVTILRAKAMLDLKRRSRRGTVALKNIPAPKRALAKTTNVFDVLSEEDGDKLVRLHCRCALFALPVVARCVYVCVGECVCLSCACVCGARAGFPLCVISPCGLLLSCAFAGAVDLAERRE